MIEGLPPSHHRHLSAIPGGTDDDDVDVYEECDCTDLGNDLLYIALAICLCSIIGLPLLVKLGKCIQKRRRRNKSSGNSSSDEVVGGEQVEEEEGASAKSPSFLQRCCCNFAFRRRKRGVSAENIDTRQELVARARQREARESLIMRQQNQQAVADEQAQVDVDIAGTVEISLKYPSDVQSPEEQMQIKDIIEQNNLTN